MALPGLWLCGPMGVGNSTVLACRLSIDEGGLQARLEMRSAGYGPPVPGRQ
jgi:hypothetical protein